MSNGLYLFKLGVGYVGSYPSLEIARKERDKRGIGWSITPSVPHGVEVITPEGEIIPDEACALTSDERAELSRLEAIIEPKKQSFIDVGNALLEIRERRLYREVGTWEVYCAQRWGFSRQQSDRLMGAAPVADTVSPVVTLTSEFQARQLKVLKDPNDQKFAALLAVEMAKQAGIDKPTAHEFRAAAETVQEMHGTGYVTIDDIHLRPGEPMPAAVASGLNRAMEIIHRQHQHINDNSPYGRLENGMFVGQAGRFARWFEDLVNAGLCAEMEIKVVVYVKKVETP